MKIPAHTKSLADKYFADQNKRLGALSAHDKQLYNQAADLIVNERLADAGVKARGLTRKPKQHELNRAWPTPRTYEQAFGRGKTSVVAVDPVKLAKDNADGLTIEAQLDQWAQEKQAANLYIKYLKDARAPFDLRDSADETLLGDK